jgi:cytidine deaminase
MTSKMLTELAARARENAYAPYSNFYVGAALLTKDKEVFTGCNIESASYSPTCCAERVAIFKAVSEGKKDFEAIAIVGGAKGQSTDAPCYPCGVCRQVLSEFAGADLKIYFADGSETTLGSLLPHAFDLK